MLNRTVATLSLLCLVAVSLVFLAACQRESAPPAFRVALVTPGSIADASWNSGAYRGLMQVRDSLGVAVSTVEAHTPAEQEEALRTYAAQGYDLVFGHGFEFQGPAERVSAQYPKTQFIVTSGERVSGNVSPLIFRLYEASFLAGVVAGGMTKSGSIGFVGGIELPPIKDAEAAWVAGARAVNPRIVPRSVYLNTFDDVAAGREAAIAMIRAGVDMFHHNADAASLGAFQAVKESRHAFIFGANEDQRALAPDRVIGSAVIDLPKAILAVAREVKAGSFRPREESFGLKSGVVSYVPNPALESTIPPPLLARLQAASDSIIAHDPGSAPPP
jgi:basic membrane lipoprotein Med (substrate-binding protein (PBP1-ABC) superfamily)